MRRLVVAGALAVVVLVAVVAQLALPGIASKRLRDRLARDGRVLSASVHAFPAIELLWHRADRVVIRLGSYTTPSGPLGSSLGQTADVGSLDASAGEVHAGLLALHGARLIKRGSRLSASATVTEADLRAALPVLRSVVPVASASGQLVLQGTASLFGVTATVQAVVRAERGKLVVLPNVPFGGFATITLFSNPHVRVQSVAATPVAGGFVVRGSARVG